MGKTKDGHVIVRDNKELGRIGENLVLCRYVDRGWKPVAVNWRAGAKAELDVIVFRESEDLLCFCEVKTRSIDRGRSGTDIAPAILLIFFKLEFSIISLLFISHEERLILSLLVKVLLCSGLKSLERDFIFIDSESGIISEFIVFSDSELSFLFESDFISLKLFSLNKSLISLLILLYTFIIFI